jgi:hypothetical protein
MQKKAKEEARERQRSDSVSSMDMTDTDCSEYSRGEESQMTVSLSQITASGRAKRKSKGRRGSNAGRGDQSLRSEATETSLYQVSDATASLEVHYQNFVDKKKKKKYKQRLGVKTKEDVVVEEEEVVVSSREMRGGDASLVKAAYLSLTMPSLREAGYVVDDKMNPIDDKFIEFEVRVKVSGIPAWSQWHGYHTFQELHENLRDRLEFGQLPPFPPPFKLHDWLGHGMEKEFTRSRRLELQQYMQLVLQEGEGRMLTNTLMRSFLGMNRGEHFVEPERLVKYLQKEEAEKAPADHGIRATMIPCVAREPSCVLM